MPGPIESWRRRRRRREIVRRMRELDLLDATYGLGAMPEATSGAATAAPRRRTSWFWLFVACLLALTLVLAVNARRPPASPDAYAFLVTKASGEPVRWNSCQPIRYVVDPEGAPDDWEELISTGIAHVSAASGLEFTDLGVTSDRNFHQRRPGQPVLVGWADEEEDEALAGNTAGVAGPVWTGEGPHQQFVSGMVLLDTESFDQIDRRSSQAVVDHELAHLVGLDHVDDPAQLMAPTSSLARSYAAGDLAGLAELGGHPCG